MFMCLDCRWTNDCKYYYANYMSNGIMFILIGVDLDLCCLNALRVWSIGGLQ